MRVNHDRVLALPLDLRGCAGVLRGPFCALLLMANAIFFRLSCESLVALHHITVCSPVHESLACDSCKLPLSRIIKMPFRFHQPEKFLPDAIELQIELSREKGVRGACELTAQAYACHYGNIKPQQGTVSRVFYAIVHQPAALQRFIQ